MRTVGKGNPHAGGPSDLALFGLTVLIMWSTLFFVFYSRAAAQVPLRADVYASLVAGTTAEAGIDPSLIDRYFDLWQASQDRLRETITTDRELLRKMEGVLYGHVVRLRCPQSAKLLATLSPRRDWDFIPPCVRECALLLGDDGHWRDEVLALRLFRILQEYSQSATEALATEMRAGGDRRQLFLLAMKLGASNLEDALCSMLDGSGDRALAEDYLNSGNERLAKAGRDWAAARGIEIGTGNGSHRATWGKF